MGLFKKKKQEEKEPVVIKTPCEMFGHIYQDFPWIIEDKYDPRNPQYKSCIEIYEPYVCRVCHKTKMVKLQSYYENIKRAEHDEKVKQLEKQFATQLKPAPIVYDMINDMILVDKEKLKAWEKVISPQEETKGE